MSSAAPHNLALRNLEEADIPAAAALISQQAAGELLLMSFLDPDRVREFLLANNAFSILGEDEEGLQGLVSVVMEQETPDTVVGLLTRLYVRAGDSQGKIAAAIVKLALTTLQANLQQCTAEIRAGDLWAAGAVEQAGFLACGFFPSRYSGETRESSIIYSFLSEGARNLRRPHPEIISSAKTLASQILTAFGIIDDVEVRDDVLAYPLEGVYSLDPLDLETAKTILAGVELSQSEIFGYLQRTVTRFHIPVEAPAFRACRNPATGKIVGLIGYVEDAAERRIQITDILALEEDPQGWMIQELYERLKTELAPEYFEVLVSAHSPRMQKTFDQLGFAPCAYIPSFGMEHGMRSDVIRMFKLEQGYHPEEFELTSAAVQIHESVNTILKDYGVGNAVVKLLQDLKIFRGLGEGELRKVARLFAQKLYRPGETLFDEGSTGRELFIIERGEVEIRSKDRVLGSLKNGTVLGEIAFLNGEPRTAQAVSTTATIVRVIQHEDFNRLIQHEAHLGMVFYRNVALDLSEKLKRSVIQAKSK